LGLCDAYINQWFFASFRLSLTMNGVTYFVLLVAALSALEVVQSKPMGNVIDCKLTL